MRQIRFNGELRRVAPGVTLADLVGDMVDQPQTVATAVNGEFVPREARAGRELHDGDAVFTFEAITGG